MERAALKAALEWYGEAGVDEALGDAPRNRRAERPAVVSAPAPAREVALPVYEQPQAFNGSEAGHSAPALLGKSDARAEAVRLAQQAETLEDLRAAIAGFDGLALRKTATNLVFCDGNPQAPVMLVGEAPGADEDRLGKPFVGVSGQLLDRILACIDVSRTQDDPARALYISNILNWRPPGNRTPSPAEVEVSLPFIERHIQLARPKLLILCGGVSAKALLGSADGISRLRRKWHNYTPQTSELGPCEPIPALATYHPAYLLRTPSQKRAVWQDMLMIQEKSAALGLRP